MVVGLGHQLLGVMMETGSVQGTGGTGGQGTVVRPDPFYVDQAANTLEHLIEVRLSHYLLHTGLRWSLKIKYIFRWESPPCATNG